MSQTGTDSKTVFSDRSSRMPQVADEISLYDMVHIFAKHLRLWWIVLLACLLIGGGGLLWKMAHPNYRYVATITLPVTHLDGKADLILDSKWMAQQLTRALVRLNYPDSPSADHKSLPIWKFEMISASASNHTPDLPSMVGGHVQLSTLSDHFHERSLTLELASFTAKLKALFSVPIKLWKTQQEQQLHSLDQRVTLFQAVLGKSMANQDQGLVPTLSSLMQQQLQLKQQLSALGGVQLKGIERQAVLMHWARMISVVVCAALFIACLAVSWAAFVSGYKRRVECEDDWREK